MSSFEVEIALFPNDITNCTLIIINSDGVSVQHVEAEEALMWMALILTSDGELSVKHNIFNPEIKYFRAIGTYNSQE